MEEKLSKLGIKENKFQINSVLYKNTSIVIDKLRILNKRIYIYVIDNSIKVYDCISFKEISNLKLPFNREVKWIDKEFMKIEILDNDIALIFADKKLYFYEINLKENKLNFLHYLSDIHHFCYLPKRKEIFLLTENTSKNGEPIGMAKSDLLGKIIFNNKIEPKIFYEFNPPKEISNETIFWMSSSRTPIHFSKFDGFNNDKYIINICGYTDNWYHYNNMGPKDENYNITIYNSDDLKEIFNEDYEVDLRYVKLTDILFKKKYDDLSIFYYNEKENKINYVKNLYNGIYKFFDIVYEQEIQEYFENCKYFYLTNNKFGIFTKNNLYILDLSKGVVKKIKMKGIYEEEDLRHNIKYLSSFKLDGNEYLYISVSNFNKDTHETKSKIIQGIIL